MHIKIMANELMRALSTAMHALAPKNSNHQLEGVLFTCMDDGRIRLTISNDNMMIESFRKANIIEGGKVLFPARILYDLIRRLDGELDIECNEEKRTAKVVAYNSKTDIRLMEAANYPLPPVLDKEVSVRIKEKDLVRAVFGTTFAAAPPDAQNRSLRGCMFDFKDGVVNFVCLDGFRVAIHRVKVESASAPKARAILERDAMNEIAKMLSPESEDYLSFHVSIDAMKVCINDETIIYNGQMLGKFIEYESLLPKSWTTTVKINRLTFISAVERSNIFSKFVNNLVVMKLSEEGMKLVVKSEQGNVDDIVPIELEGAPLTLGFNNRYLMEMLKNINETDIFMHFNTNISPCIVMPKEGDEFYYLVLPMRLSGLEC